MTALAIFFLRIEGTVFVVALAMTFIGHFDEKDNADRGAIIGGLGILAIVVDAAVAAITIVWGVV